ncbi:MAG TPA: FAD-binding oxidoreductase [Acidimicrobiia bacterium]|nr:FAD-binding oxidoreductase [Acidimicrobiia bacterium]
MTALRSTIARLFGAYEGELEGAPAADFTLAPRTIEDAARMLDFAAEHELKVLVWGGGTHQGIGHVVQPDMVVTTALLDQIVEWRPDDLTVVVEAGVRVAALEHELAERAQTAVLPERPGTATIGGVVAAGVSGWRRHRFGPTRDRVLEVILATGDGRVVKGGAQVVKNVTGYDIPRLATGSLGSLGLIGRVCLKLWPDGARSATVRMDEPERAVAGTYRPLAILETDSGCAVYLSGTEREVEAQATALGGPITDGLDWPDPPNGEVIVSVRVPPALTVEAVHRLPAPESFVAQHGVGEVTASFGEIQAQALGALRSWAEAKGGAMVLQSRPKGFDLDPWGMPPSTVALQRRIKAVFDPVGVMAPGRLPGGL